MNNKIIKIIATIIILVISILLLLFSIKQLLYPPHHHVADSRAVGTIEALGVDGFNAQFEQYLGENKTKAQAAGLVSKVISNNANSIVEDEIISITFISDINGDESVTAFESGDLIKIRQDINTISNKRYGIEASSYDEKGILDVITIRQESR